MTFNEEILVVEDSPTQAERLRYLLERNGFQVTVARDGSEALAMLREAVPSLVITDVVMPGMDGYELCEQIKSDEAMSDVPVILVTSLAEPQDIVRSLQCGADNFIRKPYDDKYLLSRVANILTSRELRDSGRLNIGVEVYLAGERHFISAERQQILDFLLSTYEEVAQINDELAAKSERLREAKEELERRAAEVERANRELQARQLELERALRDLDGERRRAQELADVKRAVLDATTDGITLVDAAGKTVLSNRALGAMLRELTGSDDDAVIDDIDALAALTADPAGFRALADAMSADARAEARYELDVPHAGKHLSVFTAPVPDSSGHLIGRIVVVRDITAEHEGERLKADLIATVSHELRTPLASVLGFAELLGSRELDEPARRRYVDIIATEARRLTDLLNDFLDLNTIEEGWFGVTPEPLDLADIVRQQVETFSGQSTAHTLTARLPDAPLPVVGEPNRLRQVLANLLSNAIKYTPDGGPVETTARAGDGYVEVAVRDRGLGIPLGQQDKIFTKFFRVDSSDTREIGGTGLGLALCREVVHAHHGEVGFDSREGEGSTFWFRLPLHETADMTSTGTDARADAVTDIDRATSSRHLSPHR